MLSALLLFSGCERDMETEGPDLKDLYGELSVLEPLAVSLPSADFSTGEKVHFTARFSKIVDWKLTITGNVSGGQKIFEGKSRTVDVSNAEWAGETTLLPIFQAEECKVHLSAANDSLKFDETFTIKNIKANEGLVVADFENGWNDDWETFVQSGADMSFVIAEDDPAAQGNFYYDMGGEVNWDWLIGMIEFPGSAYGDEPTFPLSSNADNLYFNAMIYMPEGITNSVILFQFREDENGDDEFTEASEDMYSLELKGDFETGWQLVSIKYSDMVALANGAPVEPNGNGNFEPDKLWRISLLFLANPNSGYSQAYLDYVIFTENGPLKP